MPRYFDPQNRADELLIHSSVRDHDELETVSIQVEREVIRFFTERDPVTELLEVKLKDWDADPANVEPQMAQDLKETIAAVVSWRLRAHDEAGNVVEESLGEYSVSYAGFNIGKKSPLWPDNWSHRLTLYDEREVGWFA